MPAIVQQIDRLSPIEKMQIVQHLLQSLSCLLADKSPQDGWQMPQKAKRIGLMEGKWTVPSFDEEKIRSSTKRFSECSTWRAPRYEDPA